MRCLLSTDPLSGRAHLLRVVEVRQQATEHGQQVRVARLPLQRAADAQSVQALTRLLTHERLQHVIINRGQALS